MPNDPSTAGPEGAAAAVASAKEALAKGSKLTQSVEGNSTSSFAPKEPPKEVPGISKYHVARAATKAGGSSGLTGLVNQASGEDAIGRHDAAVKQSQ